MSAVRTIPPTVDECGQNHSSNRNQIELNVSEPVKSPDPIVDRIIDCEIYQAVKPYGEDDAAMTPTPDFCEDVR
jgi:hypothetical protein